MADTQQRKISLLLACKMWQYVFRALKLPKDDSEEDQTTEENSENQ